MLQNERSFSTKVEENSSVLTFTKLNGSLNLVPEASSEPVKYLKCSDLQK